MKKLILLLLILLTFAPPGKASLEEISFTIMLNRTVTKGYVLKYQRSSDTETEFTTNGNTSFSQINYLRLYKGGQPVVKISFSKPITAVGKNPTNTGSGTGSGLTIPQGTTMTFEAEQFGAISAIELDNGCSIYHKPITAAVFANAFKTETEGTWTASNGNDDYQLFTPATPAQSITFTQLNSGLAVPVQTVVIHWKGPVAAPTVNMSRPTSGGYPILENGEYQYLKADEYIRLEVPEDAEKLLYTIDDTDPVKRGIELQPVDFIGKLDLPTAQVNQSTVVRAVCLDSDGNAGPELRVVCRRVAVTPPAKPVINEYSTNAQLVRTTTGGNYYELLSPYQPYNGSGEIALTDDQLLLKLNANYTQDYNQYLEYAITDDPEPPTADNKFSGIGGFEADVMPLNLPFKNNRDGTYDTYPPMFFTETGAGSYRSQCYLHIRAVNDPNHNTDAYAPSEVLTIRIVRSAPATPSLSLAPGSNGTWNDRGTVASLTYMETGLSNTYINIAQNLVDAPNLGESTAILQYYFKQHRENEPWPGADPGNVQWMALEQPTLKIANNGLGEGRLYIRNYDTRTSAGGTPAMLDLEPVYPSSLDLDLSTFTAAEQELVNIRSTSPLIVTGAYTTDAEPGGGKRTYYAYFTTTNGRAIKAVINSTSEPEVFKSYRLDTENGQRLTIPSGSLTGRIHYITTENVNGQQVRSMPELWITPGSEDFTAYMPEATPMVIDYYPNGGVIKEERTSITAADFNKYVTLRSLTWLGDGYKVRTDDGTVLTLYSRLNVEGYDFSADMEKVAETAAKDGEKLFAATGFVGQLNTALALLTTESTRQCPGTPTAYAPNIITGTPDEEGYIQVNAISDQFYIDIVGNAEGESEFECYTQEMDPNHQNPVILVNHNNRKAINVDFTTGAKTRTYWVYAKLNGMYSLKPLKLKVTKYEATQINSIKDFKKHEADCQLDHGNTDPDIYYQMTASADMPGTVIIEAITPQYLYVRDYPVTSQAETDENHLHTLLIRNEKGWKATVDKAGTQDTLVVGDVITGFALRPRHVTGNIISNSTDFARTFRWVEYVKGYKPEPTERVVNYTSSATGSGTDFKFGENDRMTLVTLSGVKVKKSTDGSTYTLDIAGDYPTDLTFDIFTTRGGWVESYAPGVGFNITGVVIRASATEERYAFAPISFTSEVGKLATPEVYLDNIAEALRDQIEQPYVDGHIVMKARAVDTDGNPVATNEYPVTIHYSIDGLDPLDNIGSRIRYNEDGDNPDLELGNGTIEVRAFAARGGMTPSDVVVRRFVKNSTDVQYILNFLNSAKEGSLYRFTSDLKVVAAGGDYLFLAGPIGHFLPIYKANGWTDVELKEGQYVRGFTVGYTVDSNNNRVAVATGLGNTFTTVTDEADIAKDDRINVTPDVVTSLSTGNARRLVQLMNVTVTSTTAASPGSETQWNVTELSDGKTHPMIVGRLGDITVTGDDDGAELVDGATYNITGFVMLGNNTGDSQIEIWPLSAERITRSSGVEVELANIVSRRTDDKGEIFATFEGLCEVTLTAATHGGTILYALESENPDIDKATWYEYQRPFIVTASERIHALSKEPGAAESDHTHITLTALAPSGEVEFDVTAGDGVTTVSLSAAEGATIWYSTGSDRSCKNEYDGTPLTFTEPTMLYACAQEQDQSRSSVSSIYVMVVSGVNPAEPADRISGRVKFEQTTTDDGKVLIRISPEQPIAGGYKIYYTLDGTITIDDDHLYREPGFEMPESGYVMAVLVEEGKPAGQTCEVYVWVVPANPSAIDSVGADSADSVRVEGSSIIAPEGSEIYDIAGRRVRPDSLRPGIYIVRTPDGKTVKLTINN